MVEPVAPLLESLPSWRAKLQGLGFGSENGAVGASGFDSSTEQRATSQRGQLPIRLVSTAGLATMSFAKLVSQPGCAGWDDSFVPPSNGSSMRNVSKCQNESTLQGFLLLPERSPPGCRASSPQISSKRPTPFFQQSDGRIAPRLLPRLPQLNWHQGNQAEQ